MHGLAANGPIGYNRIGWFGHFELEHDEDTLNNRRKFMQRAATASIAIGFCHCDSIECDAGFGAFDPRANGQMRAALPWIVTEGGG